MRGTTRRFNIPPENLRTKRFLFPLPLFIYFFIYDLVQQTHCAHCVLSRVCAVRTVNYFSDNEWRPNSKRTSCVINNSGPRTHAAADTHTVLPVRSAKSAQPSHAPLSSPTLAHPSPQKGADSHVYGHKRSAPHSVIETGKCPRDTVSYPLVSAAFHSPTTSRPRSGGGDNKQT